MRAKEGSYGVSANENSCAHHVTWGPNKLWRSNSIFKLCFLSTSSSRHCVLAVMGSCGRREEEPRLEEEERGGQGESPPPSPPSLASRYTIT